MVYFEVMCESGGGVIELLSGVIYLFSNFIIYKMIFIDYMVYGWSGDVSKLSDIFYGGYVFFFMSVLLKRF